MKHFNLLFLWTVLTIISKVYGEGTPIWNMYKWGPNAQAWCRFQCNEKIPAGTIFKVSFSGPTKDFTTFDNLKLLSVEGTSYIVESNYDIWPWGADQFCMFQFGLIYEGIKLQGNCSYYTSTPSLNVPSVPSSNVPEIYTHRDLDSRSSKGIDLATWDNTLRPETGSWRYQGRCTITCFGKYEPGSLLIKMVLDKDTTNFNGFGAFEPYGTVDTYRRMWTVVNRKRIKSKYGLCEFDFELDHQNETPIPKGTCFQV